MRLYLRLAESQKLVPFNYQPFLTSAIHKWIGKNNDFHDALSLYSFSWLQNLSIRNKSDLSITGDSYFFVSAYDELLIKKILQGIMHDPQFCFGSTVTDVILGDNPNFSVRQTFLTASPVFIKRKIGSNEKHITYEDLESSLYLTETLKKKLKAANIQSEGVQVMFDKDYEKPKTKISWYNGIGNRVSVCPIIISGTPEQIAFAWNVGVGNSTGIGFGALK